MIALDTIYASQRASTIVGHMLKRRKQAATYETTLFGLDFVAGETCRKYANDTRL
jgi:hypothetical protein